MSSPSDKEIYNSTVESYENSVLFKDKKWAYITDSSTNGGQFQNQVQIDLGTLSSQSNWVSMKEAVIQWPVKLTITNTNTVSQTPSRVAIQSAVLKNGFHQMIDSASLVIDGQTVQTSQIFKNVETHFKILKDWSKDTVDKYGGTIGWGLDRTEVSLSETAISLGNLSLSTVAPTGQGVNNTNVSANMHNVGVKERLEHQNISCTDFQNAILGTNTSSTGHSQVDAGASATAAGADCYCQFVMCTVRLRDLFDFVEKMPLVRNLRGFIYLNLNAYYTDISTDATGAILSINHQQKYGRTHPAMLRLENNTDSQSFYPSVSAANSWRFLVESSGVPSANRTLAQPSLTYCRLNVPYYVANPQIDEILSQKKQFRYLEYQVSEFDLGANSGKTITLSPGIANAKSVLLIPFYTTINGTSVVPWTSSLDSAPATSSPYATLKNLQIQVGNINVFSNPVNYNQDMFLQEIAETGIEGGKVNELSSGLLTPELWKTWYRMYYTNISRRVNTDDGNSKSIIVSCDNATSLNMRVLAFVHYEKEVMVDTNLGQIFSGRM